MKFEVAWHLLYLTKFKKMVSPLKVYAFEYTSGGGLTDQKIPYPLMHQGEVMHRALLADLSAIPDVKVITTHDSRLPMLGLPQSALVIPVHGKFAQHFNDCVQAADAVWLVAPEFGGILESLSRKVLRRKRILLGSRPGAIRVASSKLLTVRTLANAGIPVVDTYTPKDALPGKIEAWVVKPDKGAGCINTRIFSGVRKALAWIETNGDDGYVLQPFISGQPCSLTLICCDGLARVLSCNEQRIAVLDNQFHFLGSTVNSITDSTGEFHQLAQKIATAIPGLWGYVGVDFILTEKGIVVLEVNPRMTTSCAGLHASLGCNPAELVLGLLQRSASLSHPAFKAVTVSVDVRAFDVL
ncbi:MAG: ATP-grasp domain-containing protein [Glaciimonas sp.]|nr:ATP-grasp domain-containing protein [Glaciimonas sp.]